MGVSSSSPQQPSRLDDSHSPSGHPASYQPIKRKGTAVSEELEGNLVTLGGRPRSVEGMPAELRDRRRRRDVFIGDENDDNDVSSEYFA